MQKGDGHLKASPTTGDDEQSGENNDWSPTPSAARPLVLLDNPGVSCSSEHGTPKEQVKISVSEPTKENVPPGAETSEKVQEADGGDDYDDNDDDDDDDDDQSESSNYRVPDKYKPFTKDSYERILNEELADRIRATNKRNKPAEGRLVDGELKFDTEDDEDTIQRDPNLVEGNVFYDPYNDFPDNLLGKPIEEIDKNLKEKTFVVIAKKLQKKNIYRFSATRSFFLLTPWNSIRSFCVYIATNQFFDYFVILTILVNCYFLATTGQPEFPEYIFLAIYTFEMIIKLIARGFFISKYTYLRDPWNWLDFFVIIIAYLMIVLQWLTNASLGNLTGLRTFRVLRALRTVSIIPGLKTIVNALLRAFKMLFEVIMLTMFCLMVFALFALQVYMGVLRQKCVQNVEEDDTNSISDFEQYYNAFIHNTSHWYSDDNGNYPLCGNITGAGSCPVNYTCLDNVGENPNFGFTNFDNFGWAMLTCFQLITLDFWEDTYNKVIRANGPWNICFFMIVVLFGSFYLINLMLAVVAMSYEEEAENAGKEKEREKESTEKRQRKKSLYDLTVLTVSSLRFKGSQTNEEEDGEGERDGEEGEGGDKQDESNENENAHAVGVRAHSNKLTNITHANAAAGVQNPPHGTNVSMRNPKRPLVKKESRDSGYSTHSLVSSGKAPASGKELVHQDSRDQLGGPGLLAQEPIAERKLSSQIAPLKTKTSKVSFKMKSHRTTTSIIIITAEDENTENSSISSCVIDRNCAGCRLCCICFTPWLRLQNVFYSIVSDPLFDLFITFCIVLNTVFMATEYHGMSTGLRECLRISNYVFTAIFTLEAVLKIVALSQFYFKTGWNNFDLVIVVASLIDLGLEDIDGLSVFRTFRLLRVFKLAQSWPTLRLLLTIIINTLGALANLTIVLIIVIYIFAVIGMQLFMDTYTEEKFAPDPIPRWNFSDFFHAFMMVFRVLCGEWIEPLWECMRASNELCMVVFLPTLVFGNFMVLNLFLAMLINSFASDTLQMHKGEGDKESRFKAAWERLKIICCCCCPSFTSKCDSSVEPSNAKQKAVKLDEENSKINAEVHMEKMSVELQSIENGRVSKTSDDQDTNENARAKAMKYSNADSPRMSSSPGIGSPTDDEKPESVQNSDFQMTSEIAWAEETPRSRAQRKEMKKTLSPKGRTESGSVRSRKSSASSTGSGRTPRKVGFIKGSSPARNKRKESPASSEENQSLSTSKTKPTLSTEKNNDDSVINSSNVNSESGKIPDKLIPVLKLPRKPSIVNLGKNSNGSSQKGSVVVTLAKAVKDSRNQKSTGPALGAKSLKSVFKSGAENKDNNTTGVCVQAVDKVDDELRLGDTAGTISYDQEEHEDLHVVLSCLPNFCTKRCGFWPQFNQSNFGQKWNLFRKIMLRIVDHKIFETMVLLVIAVSSISLAFEDIYLDTKPELQAALYYMNVIFCVLFSIEMLFKWFAYGLTKYFSSFWTILDFVIVLISIGSLVAESVGVDKITAFRSLRTLRALRPLRAISRWQGMRIVVNALLLAIPSIINVLLVCLVFWLIFSIMGVQFFSGKFWKCVDSRGDRVNASIVPNKESCFAQNYTWENSKINFDNVFEGYLALLQVATFEGWMEVMLDAVDATGIFGPPAMKSLQIDQQPYREASLYSYLYFVLFIIFGSFFTLNLFIGVIIDNFNMLKKKYDGSYLDMFLTSSQRNYYNTIRKLGNKKPQKTIKRPKNNFQAFFYDIAVSSHFEMAIVTVIFLNMVVMAIEHYEQAMPIADALEVMNIIFTTIFLLEMMVKLIGLRWHYYRQPWNVFDFIIVLLSIIGVILDDVLSNVFITPTLLRVVRVFRIGRVLRLIKAAKGIRKLLFALIISLPALFNIGALLFLIMYIYAIIGMSSFGNIKLTGALDDMINFQTFGNSMILLFRLATSAGWNDILGPLLITPPHCDPNYKTRPDGSRVLETNGDCSTVWLSITFMVSYILIIFLIVINMYIAVILENFSQAHEQEEVGVTEDDFDMFYVVWERYDPMATQFIKYDQLSDFVSDLEEPIGLPKPNEIALVAFNLPIVEGDKLHCLDILMALVKNVLGDVEETQEFKELQIQMDIKFQETFPTRIKTIVKSSTLQRKKEDVAARTLQRAWRRYRAQRQLRSICDLAMMNINANAGLRKNSQTTLRQRVGNALTTFFSNSRPTSSLSQITVRSNVSIKSSVSPKPVKKMHKLEVPQTGTLYSDKEIVDL